MEEANHSNKLFSLLKEANKASYPQNRREKIRKCCNFLNSIDHPFCPEMFTSQLIEELKQLVSSGLGTEFSNRDFTSYDKNDFGGYDISAQTILEFSAALLKRTASCLKGDVTADAKIHQDDDDNENLNWKSKFTFVLDILPNHLLLIAGNMNNPVWSSKNCQTASEDLLKQIIDLLECNIDDILTNDNYFVHQANLMNMREKTIFGYLLALIAVSLSRDRWEKNPFFCEVFSWLVLQVRSPNLSNHINQIMATSLNFIHSHETENKMKGLLTLKHLIENVSGEELRWYNRAEVIYETLKNQTHSKEKSVLDMVLKCLLLILKVLERNPLENSDKRNEIMSNLLRDAEMENLIVIRRVLISHLVEYIPDCGILCVRHLPKIVRVLETFIEVGDPPQETARIQAFQALENTMVVAWPRIHPHSHRILQCILKFVINIESANFEETRAGDIKPKLMSKVFTCIKMLLKINPELSSCLLEVQHSEKLSILQDFCRSLSLQAS